MLLSFVNTYLIKNYYAIHVHIKQEETVFQVIHIHKDKNNIKIIEQDFTNNFSLLVKKLKKNIPIVLSFTGKKIINKIVPNKANYLETVLFNKNPNDFYMYEQIKEENVLISVVRKEEIDGFLQKFKEHNLDVIHFNIGVFVLEYCKALLPNQNEIRTNQFSYNFSTPSFENLPDNKDIKLNDFLIGDEKIKNQFIIAFSSFLEFLQDEESTNYRQITQSSHEEFLYKKAFTTFGIFTLIFFLSLLTISFLTLNVYASKSANIQQELTFKNQELNQIENLKKDIDYKQSIINNSSLGSNEFLSLYLSEISQSVPSNMLLKEITIFPMDGKITRDEKIKISPNTIEIKGITSSKNSVNDWLKDLEKLPWIKKTEVTTYVYNNNEYEFFLNLFI